MQTSKIIAQVKKALSDHVEEHGEFLDEKDYEQWFVKYYVHYMDTMNLTKLDTPNHKRNGLH